jgi:folate-dependent phosphoribosylglycinamide formyltransferase PurN
MRALVLGSLVPQTARTIWHWLAAGHAIEELWLPEDQPSVWRRRDRRLRWLAPTWSVEAAVRRFGVPVRRVRSLRKNPSVAEAGCQPQVDVVIASCFPHVVPEAMLSYYEGRACNLHPALLPRYRGPCPAFALLFDEALDAAGVTLHLMSSKLDEGDIIAQQPTPWPNDGWFRTWEGDLADACGRLAAQELPRFLADKIAAQPQMGANSYVKRLPHGVLAIDSTIDERRARWLGSSLGQVSPLRVTTSQGEQDVGQVLTSCGAPGGRPARVGWRHVECDVADARLVLRRWDKLQRRLERTRELLALRQRPLAA